MPKLLLTANGEIPIIPQSARKIGKVRKKGKKGWSVVQSFPIAWVMAVVLPEMVMLSLGFIVV